jgi:hypothetical protein
VDENTGWAVGEYTYNGLQNTYKTTDGGRTWIPIDIGSILAPVSSEQFFSLIV